MKEPSVIQQQKRRGPPKRGYGDAHMLLPPDLIEWAKNQPEGMSALVRRLLAEERRRQIGH